MAFKIALNPTFKTQVDVHIKNDKGIFQKSTFTVQFARTDMDEVEELRKLPQTDVIRKKLVGWEGLLAEDNAVVEYNETNLDIVLKIPEAVLGLSESFWSSIYKQREKN
ncbi:hypothetical protein [Nitrosomonas communis]|uniref:Uncharacterized protein n=1 Tax=Nitrosomonas communis TaxID=44574 RepID=A0A1I4UVZ6_9PROT|nr:hypothetical protein [Nitrosomonas communis]SFM92923.1 hypothetical protein SAMN05421863_107116 [Nitrosomonas communis]